jgi:hypothetical protein
MFATIVRLAACAPGSAFNPFQGPATMAALGGGVLIIHTGVYWLGWFIFRLSRRVTPSIRTRVQPWFAVAYSFAIIPVAAVALWLLLQAYTYTAMCAPINDAALDAQERQMNSAWLVAAAIFILSWVWILGGDAALMILSIVSASQRRQYQNVPHS